MSHDTPTLDTLTASYALTYTYRRSVGPVLGAFFTGLRDGLILGIRGADGRVLVPPQEYDPQTGDTLETLVEVGQSGVVTTWAWVHTPRPAHPLSTAFAWALIKLDGADSSLLHAVSAADESLMRTGMRVTARWRPERVGEIGDIACFEPEALAQRRETPTTKPEDKPVRSLKTPVDLTYRIVAGVSRSHFLRAIKDRRIIGRRCPKCEKVLVPPRGACPTCGCEAQDEVEVSQVGTVTTFCVVNIPFEGQRLKPPYVCASVLLDGADTPLFHLVGGLDPKDARMGLRVRARWAPQEELAETLESIQCFEPTDEPDAPFESYEAYL